MSTSWSIYVIALVAANIIGCAWLLLANRKSKTGGEGESVGHEFDGIEELNTPMPGWWIWMFWLTIAFAIIYLLAFPGLGNFAGFLGWTSQQQYETEIAEANAQYGPIFAGYYAKSIPELVPDPRAVEIGSRLFANNCAICHGSDARGGRHYPNLTDDDWLYGGTPETIVQTVTNGRNGIMPPMGAAIGGEQGVREMAQYVLSLSGREHDAAMAATAKPKFQTICAACHTVAGTGNQAMGAPNLTDDIWLHGGRVEHIEEQIALGRNNQMPAHRDILTPEKIHLVALYVYSLSNSKQ
jgi:cytochrome c oxidase cbb3-type subunit 3